MTPEPEPRFVSVKELAQILGIDGSIIRSAVSRGVISPTRFGRTIRFSSALIDQIRDALAGNSCCEVYVIGLKGKDRPVKIGMGDAKKRLRKLQTGSPKELEIKWAQLLPNRSAARAIEKELHQACALSAIHGEWFNTTPDYVARIAALISHRMYGPLPSKSSGL